MRRVLVEVAVFSHRSRDGNAARMRKMIPKWPRRQWVKSRLLLQLMLVLCHPSLCICHYLVARKLRGANHNFRLRACFSARVTTADKLDHDKSCLMDLGYSTYSNHSVHKNGMCFCDPHLRLKIQWTHLRTESAIGTGSGTQ